MSLSNKIALILGATGVVGSGAAKNFVKEDAKVILVARDQGKLEKLKKCIVEETKKPESHILGILAASFDDEKKTLAAKEKVLSFLPKDNQRIDHIVSAIAFIDIAQNPPLGSSTDDLRQCFEDGLYPNYEASKAFLPLVRKNQGSTYTIVSGGFAHKCYDNKLWLGTMKNAALNALAQCIITETKDDPVNVNCYCIHHGVAEQESDKNKLGMESISHVQVGKVFTCIAKGALKKNGEVICGEDFATTRRLCGEEQEAGVPSKASR